MHRRATVSVYAQTAMNNEKPILVLKGLDTRKMYSSVRMIFSRLGGSIDIHSAIKVIMTEFIKEMEMVCLVTVLKTG